MKRFEDPFSARLVGISRSHCHEGASVNSMMFPRNSNPETGRIDEERCPQ